MSQLPECDYCENTEGLKKLDDSLVCPSCEAKGIHRANMNAKQTQEAFAQMDAPININEVLRQSRDIDQSISVRTDLFNAATTAIVDIKKAIDEDASIENKPYQLAQVLTDRLNGWKAKIFELNEQVVNAQNNQRAIQTYLNQLANTLRAEEREKLKLQDISYKPGPIRTITPKQVKIAKKSGKLDKAELRKYAAELGVAEFTLQMLVVSKGITVAQAADMLKKSLDAAKAVQTTTEVKADDSQTNQPHVSGQA